VRLERNALVNESRGNQKASAPVPAQPVAPAAASPAQPAAAASTQASVATQAPSTPPPAPVIDESKIEKPDKDDFQVLIPAFVTSQLKEAFEVGFLLFVPFIGIYLSIRAVIFLFAYFRR